MIGFQNPGLMPLEAATTFGINVKFGENPIGFFGTGLKYAIAVCLRLGGTFRLFLGTVEYEFYVKVEDFRGKEFGMIRMRKRNSPLKRWSYEKLAFTTELGKHWEPWMAVRELESNTRDEGGSSFYWEDTEKDPVEFLKSFGTSPEGEGSIGEGKTCIVIECEEMENSYNEQVIFMPDNIELICENRYVQIFDQPAEHIFFRGLRVTDCKPTMFTYNLIEGVTLTEDRTSKYTYSDQIYIMKALQSMTDVDKLDTIMDLKESESYEGDLPWDSDYGTQGSTWVAHVSYRFHSGAHLPKRIKSFYESRVEEDAQEKFLDVKLTEPMIVTIRELIKEHCLNENIDIVVQLNHASQDNLIADPEIIF
jgi:hypothetical protein